MSESDETKQIVTDSKETEEFARMFANFMRNSFAMTNTDATNKSHNPPPEIVVDTKSLDIGYKLNNENYSLWAVFMERAISGRGMISHLTGHPPPPTKTDPAFARWQQADHCVFTWLVQNIEPKLVSRISKHATTREVWKSLAVTYSSGGDRIQVYDLRRRATTLKQKGETLEEIWSQLQEIWLAIDQKSPNPMKYQEDVEIYDNCTQEDRVYQLLTALDDKYESTKREILKMEPFPSLDEAYATIRREDARMSVLQPAQNEGKNAMQGVGVGLAVRNRPPQSQRSGGGGGGIGEWMKTGPKWCAQYVAGKNIPRRLASRWWGSRGGGKPNMADHRHQAQTEAVNRHQAEAEGVQPYQWLETEHPPPSGATPRPHQSEAASATDDRWMR